MVIVFDGSKRNVCDGMAARAGFGLIEVIVAVTLLSIGVLTVAGTAAFSQRLLRTAELQESADYAAESLADSLADAAPPNASGSRDDGMLHETWSADATTIHVTVTAHDQAIPLARTVQIVRLPRLDTLACATCEP